MKKVGHVGALVQKRTLVRSKELKGLSVSRSHLWNLAKAGKIERVGRGLYRAKEAPISTNETLLEVAKRVPLGVLCLSSALRFHGTDYRKPLRSLACRRARSLVPKTGLSSCSRRPLLRSRLQVRDRNPFGERGNAARL